MEVGVYGVIYGFSRYFSIVTVVKEISFPNPLYRASCNHRRHWLTVMVYVLWVNFILGLNFICLCFGVNVYESISVYLKVPCSFFLSITILKSQKYSVAAILLVGDVGGGGWGRGTF